MADDTAAPRSRRALLTGAAATAAALAASAALPLTVSADDPNDVVREVDNPTTDTTSISNSTEDSPAFAGAATGFGYGVQGSSAAGAGVFGWSVEAPPTEEFDPSSAAFTGVFGASPPDPIGQFATGVWGTSGDIGVFGSGGVGVYGFGDYGVIGESASSAPGVLALGASPTDVALEVQGKVRFSRSGRVTLGAGKSSYKVTLAGVSSGSRVFAVLHSNRAGRWVQAVVPVTGSFTIYLNGTVSSSTYIAWFVLN